MPYRKAYESVDSEASVFADTRDAIPALIDAKETELKNEGHLIVYHEDFAYNDPGDGSTKYCGKVYYRKATIE